MWHGGTYLGGHGPQAWHVKGTQRETDKPVRAVMRDCITKWQHLTSISALDCDKAMCANVTNLTDKYLMKPEGIHDLTSEAFQPLSSCWGFSDILFKYHTQHGITCSEENLNLSQKWQWMDGWNSNNSSPLASHCWKGVHSFLFLQRKNSSKQFENTSPPSVFPPHNQNLVHG